MGLFDSVYAGCPGCGQRVEFQSKADEQPYMNSYTLDDAPAHILFDVLNDPHYCQKCGAWLAIIDPAYPPAGAQPRPSPEVVRLRDPNEGEYRSHSQGMRWWDSPFTYADIASAGEARSDATTQIGAAEGEHAVVATSDETPKGTRPAHRGGE